jgi:RNA polymerase sigma factor (sigma-70 family)
LKNLPNEELLVLYAQSNYEAFNELYLRFAGKLYGYFISRLKSEDSAKDLLQEFFQRMHVKRGLYDPRFRAESWIFTMAHNLLMSHFRKEGRNTVELKENAGRHDSEDSSEAIFRKIERAIETLPPEQKNIMKLRYFNDASYRELASKSGKTESNLRKILSRGIQNLRKVLKNDR